MLPSFDNQRPGLWHIDVLNDFRFRNITARQTLDVDSRYDFDALYPAHSGRFAKGRIEEAFVRIDFSHGFARLGRLKRNWGPYPDRSLLLSNNPYSYDAFEWQLYSSLFEFRHLFAMLPRNNHSIFNNLDDNVDGRFITAHTLNVMVGKWVTSGIFESILFTRNNSFPDFQYLNPFSIYTVTNTNQEGDGNLMLGIQWKVRPYLENVVLEGQLAIDDFQVDNENETDKEPPHWGIDASVKWNNPVVLPVDYGIQFQYQRASEWIYTVPDNNANAGERYTYLGRSLGFPANDGDRIGAGIYAAGKNFWTASLDLGYSRKGANNVNARWHDSDSGMINGLPYDYQIITFPSGTVEKTWDLTVQGAGYFNHFVDLTAVISNRFIRNKNNSPAASFSYDPLFSLVLGIHYGNFFMNLPE